MSEANPYQSPQTEGAIVPFPWESWMVVGFVLQAICVATGYTCGFLAVIGKISQQMLDGRIMPAMIPIYSILVILTTICGTKASNKQGES